MRLAALRIFFFLASVCLAACLRAEEAPLTRVADIRELSREAAARNPPVRIRGVVTFCTTRPNWGMVLQNGKEGIYVDRSLARERGWVPVQPPVPDAFERGMEIELSGIASAGHFAPILIPQHIEVLGTAPLPEPTTLSFADLLDGRWDCQRVRLRGVVQYVAHEPDRDGTRFDIAGIGGRVVVNMQHAPEDLARLVDAEVELTGVMFTYYNNRGELVGAQVQVTDPSDVRVIGRGPEDPFGAPLLELSTLRPFSREGATFHRRRCVGTVTLARPGEFFYMQEGDRGVRVESRETLPLVPGDRVEAAGFVEMAENFGKLREAAVRKIGTAPMPAPMPIARQRVLGSTLQGFVTDAEDTDGRLATLRGRLEKVDALDVDGPRLILESEGALVTATLNRETPTSELARFELGAELRIDGIIRVELAAGWPAQEFPRPVNFRLFVQSPANIAVVHAAPWWTPQRLWYALSGTGVLLALALARSARLQRRVEQRNAQLAEEMRARREATVEFSATWRERERLAADLHDTLEQALTGIAFRLETIVVRRSRTQDYSTDLDQVRQLLASTREDVRRSVWNLRLNALESQTLPQAIQSAAERLAGGRDVIVAVETTGEPRQLPDLVGGNLLLLAMEATTNALKHAEPRSIVIRVAFGEKDITLVVEDDGRGFDPAHVAGPNEGHFGVQGMRERIKRLGGSLEISSTPGAGTRITASLPVRTFEGAVESRSLAT